LNVGDVFKIKSPLFTKVSKTDLIIPSEPAQIKI